MKLYAYGGYYSDNTPDLVVVSSRLFWSNRDTIPKGVSILEYELPEGNYKTKTITSNLVRITNKGEENLVLKFLGYFKK